MADEKKEYLTFDEQMRRAGIDPYPESTASFGHTGFDDRSIVNPRTYDAVQKLQDTTGYGNIIRGQLTVSYTHLRAHETREDRVCRRRR